MGTIIRRTAIFLFLAVIVGAFIYFNVTRPRVLVLHSYNVEYAWTRDVNAGLARVFKKHPNYAIRYHYMDTKRHPGADFARAAGISARKVLADYRPDVVVIVDDDAQGLVGKHFINHADIKIVHAGINGGAEAYGYDKAKNVTGILERKPVRAVRDVIVELARMKGLKEPVRVMFLGDSSSSVKRDAEELQHVDWSPLKYVGAKFVGSWPAWQKAVLDAPKSADFIVVANYRKLTLGDDGDKLIDPAEVMPWTEQHTSLPIIGTNGFNVEDGGALAIGTSPFEQGEVAAQMAVKIIDKGIAPTQIPWRQTEQFTVAIRQGAMVEKQLVLPAVYEAFARVVDGFIPAADGQPAVIMAASTGPAATRVDAKAESKPGPKSETSRDGEGKKGASKPAPAEAAAADAVTGQESADEPAKPEQRSEAARQEASGGLEPSTPAPEQAAAADGRRKLEFRAKEQTWIEVRDAHGKKLVGRMIADGKPASVTASGPLKVRLGRLEGVQMLVNGTGVALTERDFTLE